MQRERERDRPSEHQTKASLRLAQIATGSFFPLLTVLDDASQSHSKTLVASQLS